MSRNPPKQQDRGLVKQPDPELINRFIELQTQEISVRREELGLKKQEIANTHEYAKMALEAQVQDLGDSRKHSKSTRRDRLIFAGFIVILLGAFIVYALYLGKDQIAIEILKAIVYLLAGGLGGYALKTKSSEKKDSDE